MPPVAAAGASSLCPNPATDALPKVLVAKCGLCHDPAKRNTYAANLDLVNPGAKGRLLNVGSRTCAGRVLITDRGAIVGGHFFDKIAGPTPGCGERMPPIGPALSAEEVKCLQDWIRPSR